MSEKLAGMRFYEVAAECARNQRGLADCVRTALAAQPMPPDFTDYWERVAAWHAEGAEIFEEMARRCRRSWLFRLLEWIER